MAKTEVSAVQIQLAASAGLKLLQVDDLPVPMQIAKSGALNILEGLLQALANGEVVLAQPPADENITAGPGDPPKAPVEPPKGGNAEDQTPAAEG